MTAWETATSATTNFNIYKDEVAKAAGIPVARMHLGRLYTAYDMGEPVWMIAQEMALLAEAMMKPVSSFKMPNLNSCICVKRVVI